MKPLLLTKQAKEMYEKMKDITKNQSKIIKSKYFVVKKANKK